MASTLLLALGLVAIVGLVNSRRPARSFLLAGPSWAAAAITVELAPHLVALSGLGAAVLVFLGALGDWTGWLGLAALLIADGVAVPLILRARHTALDLGPVVEELEPSEAVSPYPRWHIAFPFGALWRRGVRVVRGVRYAPSPRRVKLDVYLPTAAPPGPAAHPPRGQRLGRLQHRLPAQPPGDLPRAHRRREAGDRLGARARR
jgi:hypothetical protein